MTDPKSVNDLADSWPVEPDQADVEAFAQLLATKLPQMSDDGLARIEATMREEVAHQRRRRWRTRLVLFGAAAAALVIGVILLRPKDTAPAAPAKPAVELVHDTYPVPAHAAPVPATPDKPLIALDVYQGLFSN